MNKTFQKLIDRYPEAKRLSSILLGKVPTSLRLGKNFWEWYAFFEKSEAWDKNSLVDFQLTKLRSLLYELKKNSPFYMDRLSDIEVENINSIEEFCLTIPDLSRSNFKENYNNILNRTWKSQKLSLSQTSGTTGNSLQFYHLHNDQSREWAAICHQWKRVGYDPVKSKRVEFRGLTANGKLTESWPHQSMMRCSILNFNKESVSYFANEIQKNKMDFYHGYPSAIYLLVSEIIKNNIHFPQPKAVLLASEMIYNWQIERIKEAFPKAKIFAHYGCAERTVLAGWCETKREYHILPQYSLVEIDKKTSEIIGTNLFNSVNGFIRYRMTDRVLKKEDAACPDCLRPYTPRILEIGGRSEDYLFSPEKGWIPPAIVTYPIKSLQVIRELQFIQKEKEKIQIKYSILNSNEEQLKSDLFKMETGLIKIFGNAMKFNFELVDDFERGPTGKFKWIVSKIEEKPIK